MISTIVIGLISALTVALSQELPVILPGLPWASPVMVLGVAALAILVQRLLFERRTGHRSYDGLADLFIHIHSPASLDAPIFWFFRGGISFLLSVFSGTAGPEGAAVEFAHAFAIRVRARSARWFEQRRRTDASSALSAGIAAAFGAPFAGMLMPIELGMGGRSISVALSALVAYLGMKYLAALLSLPLFDPRGALFTVRFLGAWELVGLAAIAVICGVTGALVVRFFRYTQDSLIDLFQRQGWMRTLAGGILLFLVAVIYKSGHHSSRALFEQVLWARRSAMEGSLLFALQLLGLSAVLSGFGTVGVFWPVLTLGGLLGFGVNHWIFNEIPGLSAMAVLAGGVGFWGAIFGAPVSGAVLAFELTNNLHVLAMCLAVGILAKETRRLLKTPALVDRDLRARGLSLVDGRSESILEAAFVRDAMVSDHETAHEQEPVSSLYHRLLKSRYPFLPVVNTQGAYVGLLTADMVQEAWQTQNPQGDQHSLARLLEAKDLLYRAGFKAPVVKANDRLSVTAGIFEDIPCVPVLGDDRRVLGLLFVHNVRLAYERELGRRSLSTKAEER